MYISLLQLCYYFAQNMEVGYSELQFLLRILLVQSDRLKVGHKDLPAG